MLTPIAQENGSYSGYRFGAFLLDLDRGTLLRGDEEIPLRPKSFAVLRYLVERHGRLVSKEELLEAIWGHAYVSEGSLGQCLIDIRRALGDESREFIRTVPRRGYLFELPVSPITGAPGTPARGTGRYRLSRVGAAAGLAGLLFAAAFWGLGLGRVSLELLPFGKPGSGTGNISVAVLPFADMSPEGDNAYFADGLAEEVLNSLTRIPGLQVIARTSSFAFRGQDVDIPTVARRLDVSHVLEGSVRRSGSMVRVTVQLVDARTNLHLWSQTYDREMRDIFPVQAGIARSVAESLELSLSSEKAAMIVNRHDPAAYEHFLQGRYFFDRRRPGDVARAEEHYTRAIAIEPDYVDALVGLVGVYTVQMVEGQADEATLLARQGKLLEQALAIDPESPEANMRAARYFRIVGDRERSEKHWHVATQSGEESGLVLGRLAMKAGMEGNFEEAVRLQRSVVARDPLSIVARTNLAHSLMAFGDLEAAEAEFRTVMDLGPADRRDHEVPLVFIRILQERHDEALALARSLVEGPDRDQALAMALHRRGEPVEAEAFTTRLTALGNADAAFRLAEIHGHRGDGEAAFRALESILGRMTPAEWREWPGWIMRLHKSPFLRSLHGDSRWQRLVEELTWPTVNLEPV